MRDVRFSRGISHVRPGSPRPLVPRKTFAHNSARNSVQNLRAKFRAKFRAKLSREIPRENRTFRNRTLYRPRETGHSGTQSWTLRRQTLSESVRHSQRVSGAVRRGVTPSIRPYARCHNVSISDLSRKELAFLEGRPWPAAGRATPAGASAPALSAPPSRGHN